MIVQDVQSNTIGCFVSRAYLSIFTRPLCSLIAGDPADG